MKKSCILIIDDEPNLRKSLVDILKAKGYEMLAAEDGKAGLALLRKNSVNLVLTDLGLPDTTGIDILDRVKAEYPHTPTIILTGSATIDSAAAATYRGAFSYLLKPVEVDLLLLHIQRALEKQQVEKELRISRKMLEDVTQGISESLLLLSTDYKIMWANNTVMAQTGLTMDEIIGKYCYEVAYHRESPCEAPEKPCPLNGLHTTVKTVRHVYFDKDMNKLYLEIDVYPVRDDTGDVTAFVHVSRDISERVRMEEEIKNKVVQLEATLARVKRLEGIIPICMYCKKIRDDKEEWHRLEAYISDHSDAEFSHGICPECYGKTVEGTD